MRERAKSYTKDAKYSDNRSESHERNSQHQVVRTNGGINSMESLSDDHVVITLKKTTRNLQESQSNHYIAIFVTKSLFEEYRT